MFEKLDFLEKKLFIIGLLDAIVDAQEDEPSNDPKMRAVHAVKHIEGNCIGKMLSGEERKKLIKIVTNFYKLSKPPKLLPRYKRTKIYRNK